MSPRKLPRSPSASFDADLRRLWLGLGARVHEERLAKSWSVARLAELAGVSRWLIYCLERGQPVSIDAALRVARAMGLRLELALVDAHRRAIREVRQADVVHAAMGEFEARHFRPMGFHLGLDEPYQHFQFAGRADVVAWDLRVRALLHIENRTRFPDFQESAGSYNAKRSYLGESLARRLGIGGWASETHVIAALWSAEVLHALRLHPDSFRAICPDSSDAFWSWWAGAPPSSGKTSTLVVLDPAASGRQPIGVGLGEALSADTRPRHRGYADAAAAIEDGQAA